MEDIFKQCKYYDCINKKHMPICSANDIKKCIEKYNEGKHTTETPANTPLAGVSHNEFLSYCESVLSYLKDRKCVSVPTRVAMQVASNIEQKGISFRFMNEPKSKWTVFHYLYCHCG